MTRYTIWTVFHRHLQVGLVLSCVLAGCSAVQQSTGTPRSVIEQMLLSQAIERGLDQAVLPLPPETPLSLEAIGLDSHPGSDNNSDKRFTKGLIESWLRSQGFLVSRGAKGVKIRVVIRALGTQQAENFFGIPPISSVVIPFALPELALFKASRQMSIARFRMEVIDQKSGRLIYMTPSYEGDAYLNQYVLLFGFTFRMTDLAPPPPEV